MHFSHDSSKATKGRLGDSSLQDWASFLENSPGEKTDPPSHAFQRGLTWLRLLTRRDLVGIFILSVLFLIVLVFVCIPPTSWETQPKASSASSTVALLLENDLGIWTARKLYCSASQPCDVWNPFSEDAPFNLRLEMEIEVRLWNS